MSLAAGRPGRDCIEPECYRIDPRQLMTNVVNKGIGQTLCTGKIEVLMNELRHPLGPR